VLREWLGRVLGFEQEIEELQRQIKDLSWDPIFGMWTRGAFLQFCQVMPRGERVVALVDLAGIHDLNNRVGYREVDRRVKAAFSTPHRRSDVVARWYSGDEIVILFDSDRSWAESKIAQLEESAARQGLAFQFAIGTWAVGKQPIEEVVGRLADEVIAKKPGAGRGGRQAPTV
jgi:GGDEF domain-containing protein